MGGGFECFSGPEAVQQYLVSVGAMLVTIKSSLTHLQNNWSEIGVTIQLFNNCFSSHCQEVLGNCFLGFVCSFKREIIH